MCKSVATKLGEVKYIDITDDAFHAAHGVPEQPMYQIDDPDTSNCAVKCFEKTDCTSYYVTADACKMIMGRSWSCYSNPGSPQCPPRNDPDRVSSKFLGHF